MSFFADVHRLSTEKSPPKTMSFSAVSRIEFSDKMFEFLITNQKIEPGIM